jgi:hypothetical protein
VQVQVQVQVQEVQARQAPAAVKEAKAHTNWGIISALTRLWLCVA